MTSRNAIQRELLRISIAALLSNVPYGASADTLVGSINNLFGPAGLTFPEELNNTPPHPETHFISSSLLALGTLASSLAASSSNVPVISSAPGFGYTYNSELNTFEPNTNNNVGSVYLEGGRTSGAGKFSFGVNYSYIDFDALNGQNLAGLQVTVPHQKSPVEDSFIDVRFNTFSITSSVISSYFTYGITDKWDVNLLVPVLVTDLNIDALATINNRPLLINPNIVTNYAFEGGQTTANFATSGHKLGVGDIQLRTKYEFFGSDTLNMAGLVKVSFPTGDVDNFQGTGDYFVQPYLAVSRMFGNFDLHANGGMDIDVSRSERTRARYGLGASYQFLQNAGFMLDVLGSSNVTSQSVSAQVPQYDGQTGTFLGVNTIETPITTNIIDLSIGLKVSPVKYVSGYVNFLVPLNNDGLRTGFIPSAGVQIPL